MPKLQVRAPTLEILLCDLAKEEESEAVPWHSSAGTKKPGPRRGVVQQRNGWGKNNGNMLGRKWEKSKALSVRGTTSHLQTGEEQLCSQPSSLTDLPLHPPQDMKQVLGSERSCLHLTQGGMDQFWWCHGGPCPDPSACQGHMGQSCAPSPGWPQTPSSGPDVCPAMFWCVLQCFCVSLEPIPVSPQPQGQPSWQHRAQHSTACSSSSAQAPNRIIPEQEQAQHTQPALDLLCALPSTSLLHCSPV